MFKNMGNKLVGSLFKYYIDLTFLFLQREQINRQNDRVDTITEKKKNGLQIKKKGSSNINKIKKKTLIHEKKKHI